MAFPAPKSKLGYITAGWRYRNGGDHFAYDYAMPIGTPMYAVANGVVLDCNDGVPNNPDGVRKRPSNWILLRVRYQNRYATIYYQHLSPGLKVKPGQKVSAGQLMGYSGNSGWSTGPHLHIAAGWGEWNEYQRYSYMQNDGRNNIVIFPPSNIWRHDWGIGTHWYGYKAGVPVKYLWTRRRTHSGAANERDRWWVKQIQYRVGAKVDGYYGPETEKKVAAWKKLKGIKTNPKFVYRADAKLMGLPV